MDSKENKIKLSAREIIICFANKDNNDTKKDIGEKNTKKEILEEWLKRIKKDRERSSYIINFVIVAIILGAILGLGLGAPVNKAIGPKNAIILLIYGFIIPIVSITIFGLSYICIRPAFNTLIEKFYVPIEKLVEIFSKSEDFLKEDKKKEAVNETMCLITQCFFCSFYIFTWFSSWCYWIVNDDDLSKKGLLPPTKSFEYCLKVASLGVLDHPPLTVEEYIDKTKSNKESKKYSQEWASFYLKLCLIWIILPRLVLLAIYIIRYNFVKSIEIDLSTEPFSPIISSLLKSANLCEKKQFEPLLERKDECVDKFDKLKQDNPGSISKDYNSKFEKLKEFFKNNLEGKELVDEEIVKDAGDKIDAFENILRVIEGGTKTSERIVEPAVDSPKKGKCVVITTIDLIPNLTNIKKCLDLKTNLDLKTKIENIDFDNPKIIDNDNKGNIDLSSDCADTYLIIYLSDCYETSSRINNIIEKNNKENFKLLLLGDKEMKTPVPEDVEYWKDALADYSNLEILDI